MSSPRLWRGQTLRDRSIDRRSQLVQAGFDLLGEGGAAALTMRAACRRAGLSLRYFYENFANRDELIVAVYDSVADELRDRVGAVEASGDLTSKIRVALEACAAFFEQDPRRARIMLREPLADDTLRAHRIQQVPVFMVSVATLLGAGRETLTPRGRSELTMAASALSGALTSLFLDWTDGRLEVTRDELTVYAENLVFRALTS